MANVISKRAFLVLVVAMSLQALPQSGNVSGQILLPNGKPAPGVRVSAMLVSDSASADVVFERIVETDGTGRYNLMGLSPGRYYIVAGAIQNLTYYPGTRSTRAAQILTVDSSSTFSAVNFVVPEIIALPPLKIPLVSGRIVVEGGRKFPLFLPKLYVHLVDAPLPPMYGEDGRKIRREGTSGATPVSKDGTFHLIMPEGEFAVSLITSLGDPLSAEDGYYVKSMSFGTADLLKEKLRSRSIGTASIVITLAPTPSPGK